MWVVGCQSQPGTNRKQVIARVGDVELTIDEAKLYIDTTRGEVDAQLRNYVSYWVNTELVYHEAKRLGIDRSEEFTRQLAGVEQHLAGQLFLDRKVYTDSENVRDEALQEYFTVHASEFIIHDDMVKLNVAAFNNRERASAFAAHVSQGTSWSDAITHLQKDTVTASGILSSTVGEYFTPQTLFPRELWKVAQALDVNEVSFPIKTLAGYVIIQVLGSLKQGSPATYELARDEARQRFLLDRRRRQYDELLETLRKRYTVQVLLDSRIASDSTHAHE
ncbi:MAG: peptidyl-prolyl cis-trans isomerase [Ignavibacteriae bacterium]|nr:peptidyl-prolyl cis-trans isomerase [Ignavibacteria bacterium]MBI3365045.1 peptidyl-prolyl cis-trans isomerase [Ignavibacteriota bacterium]